VDYFEIPANGRYVIAHQEYQGGVEVQIRKRDMGNGAYFNEGAVVVLGGDTFEVTADGYYINGAPASLPTNLSGYAVSVSSPSQYRDIAEVSVGAYTLRFTTIRGADNIHITVGTAF